MNNVATTPSTPILTPDQRLRVFVSSTLQELAEERKAVKTAITELRLNPVMFELGARAHPPRALYRAYLEQSHIFVGIYWQRYGWVAPGESISGLEDEYQLSGNRPKLIYVKTPANEREERLKTLLKQIQSDDQVSYKSFSTSRELQTLLENDLAILLTERFAASLVLGRDVEPQTPPVPTEPAYVLPPSNLPESPTPLIGRVLELQKISTLLKKQEVRLVTLTGPGGVGKTRLGLEVAKRLQAVFKDGVYFVGLSAVTDPALVIPTIAKVLEIPDSKTLSPLEALEHHLEHKHVLLLLDNFEQITEAAPALSELLRAAPGLELLVTSRSPLRISAEYVAVVPPLTLPSDGRSPLEAIRDTEAVRLFTDRAKAAKQDFELTVENALAVAEICYHLDGLPLAIELAAARVPLLTPQAILKRLDKRFDLLKGGARDLPTRQQTLQNTIDWSFQLLSDADKRLFTRVAVFAGGSSLEAIEALNQEDRDINVLEGLSSLVEKSLLKQTEASGEPRFRMLETIREFALVMLEKSGEAQSVHHKHAQYFLELVETADSHITGSDSKRWLDKLELEHDNFRAVLRWAGGAGNTEFGLHLLDIGLRQAEKLTRFWWIRGYLSEGRTWLNLLLAKTKGEHSEPRAKTLHGLGVLAWQQSDVVTAQKSYEEALAIYRELGHDKGVAAMLNNLAVLALEQHEYAKARTLLQDCIVLKRKLEDRDGLATSLINLSIITRQEGDANTALTLCQEALSLQKETGNLWGMATAHLNLGGIAMDLKNLHLAREHYQNGLSLATGVGDKEAIAYGLEGWAYLAVAEGDVKRAVQLFGAAEALRESTNNIRSPVMSTLYDETVRAAKTQLGETVFTAIWSEGRALDLNKAVALALSSSKVSV